MGRGFNDFQYKLSTELERKWEQIEINIWEFQSRRVRVGYNI